MIGICNRNKQYKSLLAIHQETFEFTHTVCAHIHTSNTHTCKHTRTHTFCGIYVFSALVGVVHPPPLPQSPWILPKPHEKSIPTQIMTHTHTLPTHTHRGKFNLSSCPLNILLAFYCSIYNNSTAHSTAILQLILLLVQLLVLLLIVLWILNGIPKKSSHSDIHKLRHFYTSHN